MKVLGTCSLIVSEQFSLKKFFCSSAYPQAIHLNHEVAFKFLFSNLFGTKNQKHKTDIIDFRWIKRNLSRKILEKNFSALFYIFSYRRLYINQTTQSDLFFFLNSRIIPSPYFNDQNQSKSFGD